MGHVRLGRLPATRQWREVVELLNTDGTIAGLAHAVERAADHALAKAVDDPAFVEVLWRLLKIPEAVAAPNLVEALSKIGIHVPDEPSLDDVLAGFDAALEVARRSNMRGVTDLGLIAKAAAISALKSLVDERAPTLWARTPRDDLATLATFTSGARFADLAQRFFTNMLERHLNYFLDRETPRHIGPGRIIRSIADMNYFDGELRRHCQETTVIMINYAQVWLGKNRFHLGKDLSRTDVRNFASYAFTKIRAELSMRSGMVA